MGSANLAQENGFALHVLEFDRLCHLSSPQQQVLDLEVETFQVKVKD
jgi:hypothetical protein